MPDILAALDQLDTEGAPDDAARQRLASFLGTLFVKHAVTDTDELVLRAVAARRPHLAGKYTHECALEVHLNQQHGSNR